MTEKAGPETGQQEPVTQDHANDQFVARIDTEQLTHQRQLRDDGGEAQSDKHRAHRTRIVHAVILTQRGSATLRRNTTGLLPQKAQNSQM